MLFLGYESGKRCTKLTDITTYRHIEVQIRLLNSKLEKLGFKTRTELKKDFNGIRLVREDSMLGDYHEFTPKVHTKTELYDIIYAMNDLLERLLRESE